MQGDVLLTPTPLAAETGNWNKMHITSTVQEYDYLDEPV